MTMQVIASVAEFERDLLLERTQSGINRPKAAGKKFGRPFALSQDDQMVVLEKLAVGATVSDVARDSRPAAKPSCG
jgi:putative DNA-invertase from lambdoid prophage Rac